MPAQAFRAVQADSSEVLEQGRGARAICAAAAKAERDELGAGLFQGFAHAVECWGAAAGEAVRRLYPPDHHYGNMSLFSEFRLLQPEQRPPGTNLFGCDVRERIVSRRAISIHHYPRPSTASTSVSVRICGSTEGAPPLAG
jgi:hypothetical protein